MASDFLGAECFLLVVFGILLPIHEFADGGLRSFESKMMLIEVGKWSIFLFLRFEEALPARAWRELP